MVGRATDSGKARVSRAIDMNQSGPTLNIYILWLSDP